MIYNSILIYQFFDFPIKLTKHQINDVDLENLAVNFLLIYKTIVQIVIKCIMKFDYDNGKHLILIN